MCPKDQSTRGSLQGAGGEEEKCRGYRQWEKEKLKQSVLLQLRALEVPELMLCGPESAGVLPHCQHIWRTEKPTPSLWSFNLEKKFISSPRVKIRAQMSNACWSQLAGEACGGRQQGWMVGTRERLGDAQGAAFKEAPPFQWLPLPYTPLR